MCPSVPETMAPGPDTAPMPLFREQVDALGWKDEDSVPESGVDRHPADDYVCSTCTLPRIEAPSAMARRGELTSPATDPVVWISTFSRAVTLPVTAPWMTMAFASMA